MINKIMSIMTIKEFTESAIASYLKNGGTVHPDITLSIFQLIEKDHSLLSDYKALQKYHASVNPTIGRMIRAHFDLRNDREITVPADKPCKLIKVYKRFHKK